MVRCPPARLLRLCFMLTAPVLLFASTHSAERTKVTLWFWGAVPEYRQALQDTLIDPINRRQNKYELVVEYRTSVDNDVRLAAIASGGPDIIFTAGPGNVWPLARADKLTPMDAYAKRYGWDERLLAPVLNACRQLGHLYCVTPSLFANGLFYNKAVLRANGWELPKTVQQVEVVMKAAHAKGMYASVTGNKGWQPVNEEYLSIFMNQMMGPLEVRNLLTGRAAWSSLSQLAAITELDRWYKAGYLGGNDYFLLDFDGSFALLSEARSPFFFGPTFALQWAAKYFTGAKAEDLGFAPFPQMKPELPYPIYDIGSTFTLSINANSHVKDECAEVIDFILSADFARNIAKLWPGYWSIPLKDFPRDEGAAGVYKLYYQSLSDISSAVKRGAFGFNVTTFFPNRTKESLSQDLEAVWLDEETPREMLERAGKAFANEKRRGSVLEDIATPIFDNQH